MQFSESWLREFCDPPVGTKELADILTLAGLEVESLSPAAPPFSGVVVAEILEAIQHPNADRLRVCTVDAGTASPSGPLQIVCGAPNARAGIRVPLAMVGAVLPPGEDGKPFVINTGKLRGVDSHGMLCASDELGLGGNHEGLLELPSDAPLGQDVRKFLDLDDMVFELKLTPNLAHALSVYGVAREVSALTGSPLKKLSFPAVKAVNNDCVKVTVESKDLCGRWSGRVIKNVNPKAKTPAWMVARLERSGQRPVSALVDISNYVMFELGRPNHIFDRAKIKGSLSVRWARKGETLTLLNGKNVPLDADMGVVADDAGVESLAGIMGGESTSVTDDTKDVYVEAAFWHPDAIAGRARRLSFTSDASHRFERGVDPESMTEHIERITRLVLDICGGEPGPVEDQKTSMPERKPVTMRVGRAAKILGMAVTRDDCAKVFDRLGLKYSEKDLSFTVAPPSWRFDLEREEDLVEEVLRVIGLDKLPDTPPLAPVRVSVLSESRRSPNQLRRAIASLGYRETINYAFVEEKWERDFARNDTPIRLLNPIAAPLAVMRSSLTGSLIEVLKRNLARKASRVRVFEVGRVFSRDPSVQASLSAVKGVRQPLLAAGLAYGPCDELQWGTADRAVDFYDVKGDVESLLAPRLASFSPSSCPALHPGRSADISVDGKTVGWVGELHPKWVKAYDLPLAPVLFELDAAFLMETPMPVPQPVSKFQGAVRDIALVAGSEAGAQAVLDSIRASDGTGILRNAFVFDVYRPAKPSGDMKEGERSLAIRLELQDDRAALTEDTIAAVTQAAVDAAGLKHGTRLRA